jgi:60 kDa SS-A/Ro ribonucleoprotein
MGITGILAGRLVPINFIAAARHNPQFEPELEAKFFECFAGKKKSADKTVLPIDISPSMNATLPAQSELTRTDVACSLAMIAREMFTDVRVFSFSSQRIEVAPRRGFALRDAIKNSQPSNGTLLGAALRQVPKHERLIVITDEESQDSIPQMDGYMINVASTKNGVGYGKWLHIDGWSDKVLEYILRYE